MKPEQLQDALNDVKEEYIADAHKEESETNSAKATGNLPFALTGSERKGLKKIFRRPSFRIALVACLLLVLGGGAIFATVTHGRTHDKPTPSKPGSVHIPPAEMPKLSATADMLGLICHNGKVYTEAQIFSSDVKEDIWGLVGTYLGETNCEIHEWTARQNENWITELASNVAGTVYTVNGYDDDFRICTAGEWYPEEGGVRYFVFFYECLNGITLNQGSDLIHHKLRIMDRLPDTVEKETKTLLDALYKAPFIVIKPDPESGYYYYGDKSKDFRYMENYNAYLEIPLTDGTSNRFIVYKNGYVKYNCFDLRDCYMVVDPALVEYLFQ